MDITLRPGSIIEGNLIAPPSKSDAHRALICAALRGDGAQVSGMGDSIDVLTTMEALEAMGVISRRNRDSFCCTGWADPTGEAVINCRESGSTLRFLLPVCAALGRTCTFTGEGRLPLRPISVILDEMANHGVSSSSSQMPLRLSGRLKPGQYTIPGNISSQFISGLLMALPYAGGISSIHIPGKLESAAYVDMTTDTLTHYGIRWDSRTTEAGTTYTMASAQAEANPPRPYVVEGDWSGAAFLLASGALGGHVQVGGLDPESRQGDKAIAHILEQMGATVAWTRSRHVAVTAPDATAGSGALRPADVDVSPVPDLFPVLAVLAAGAEGTSVLRNVARLRIKESDRVETVCNMIEALGGSIRVEGDTVYVDGTGRLTGGVVDSCGDHRIAMSAAVASLICRDQVTILGAQCCSKSYPGFFEDFAKIGGSQV